MLFREPASNNSRSVFRRGRHGIDWQTVRQWTCRGGMLTGRKPNESSNLNRQEKCATTVRNDLQQRWSSPHGGIKDRPEKSGLTDFLVSQFSDQALCASHALQGWGQAKHLR